MSTIFTKIINGEIPSYKIMENEKHLAFLDVMPVTEGHTLVIPKQKVDFIFDMESEAHKELWAFAQKTAKQLQKAYPDKRIGVAVVGLEVPHAHIHLIPISNISDMNFANKRLNLQPENYLEIQKNIVNS